MNYATRNPQTFLKEKIKKRQKNKKESLIHWQAGPACKAFAKKILPGCGHRKIIALMNAADGLEIFFAKLVLALQDGIRLAFVRPA